MVRTNYLRICSMILFETRLNHVIAASYDDNDELFTNSKSKHRCFEILQMFALINLLWISFELGFLGSLGVQHFSQQDNVAAFSACRFLSVEIFSWLTDVWIKLKAFRCALIVQHRSLQGLRFYYQITSTHVHTWYCISVCTVFIEDTTYSVTILWRPKLSTCISTQVMRTWFLWPGNGVETEIATVGGFVVSSQIVEHVGNGY